jgi:hypothetical protein
VGRTAITGAQPIWDVLLVPEALRRTDAGVERNRVTNGVSVAQAVVTTGQYRLDNGPVVVVGRTQAPQN